MLAPMIYGAGALRARRRVRYLPLFMRWARGGHEAGARRVRSLPLFIWRVRGGCGGGCDFSHYIYGGCEAGAEAGAISPIISRAGAHTPFGVINL